MKPRAARLIFAAFVILFLPRIASAQSPSVVLPVAAARAIAVEFDRGLSPLYCYFGVRIERPTLVVRVDSVTKVASPADCPGIGIALVIRITDRLLLAQAVRGVIDSNPRFAIVSAFYLTEDVDDGGESVHAARALSVVRGTPIALTQGGS